MEIDATFAALFGTLMTAVVALGTTIATNRAAAARQKAEQEARDKDAERAERTRRLAEEREDALRVRDANRAAVVFLVEVVVRARERPGPIPAEVSARVEEIRDPRARFVLHAGFATLSLTANRPDFFLCHQWMCDWMRDQLGELLREEAGPDPAERLDILRRSLETSAALRRSTDSGWLAAVVWARWSRLAELGVRVQPIEIDDADEQKIALLLGEHFRRPASAVRVALDAAEVHEVAAAVITAGREESAD